MVEGGRNLFNRARVRRSRALVVISMLLVASLIGGGALDAFAGSKPKRKHRVERKHTHKKQRKDQKIHYAFPVWKKLASSGEIRAPHHDYPAWDLPMHAGTRVRSVTSGYVKSVTRWGACGKGVIIKGRDGYTYTYCHGSALAVRRGWKVWPGRVVMRSGSTGHSTGPHLHLQIEKRGRKVCPQPLLSAWKHGKNRSPSSSGPWACFYGPGSGRKAALKRHKARVRREQRGDGKKDRKRRVRSKRRGEKATHRTKARRDRKKDKKRAFRGKAKSRDRSKKRSRRSAAAKAGDRAQRVAATRVEEDHLELPVAPEVPVLESVEEPALLIVKPIELLY
jgi:Peptidase family M23